MLILLPPSEGKTVPRPVRRWTRDPRPRLRAHRSARARPHGAGQAVVRSPLDRIEVLGLSDGQAIELERKPLAAGIARGATLIEPDAPGKPFTLEVVDSV